MGFTTIEAAENEHVSSCITQKPDLSIVTINDLHKTPISAQVRSEIIRGFLHQNPSVRGKHSTLDWDTYFVYYTKQCIQALHDRGRHVSVRTHQDILDIIYHLEDLSTKDAIKTILKPKLTAPKSEKEAETLLEGSINLAARLLLMMDIGVHPLGFSGRRELNWSEGSLKDFVHKHFEQPQVLRHENIKLEKIFTARNLDRMTGIKIEWTDNIAEHLRIVGDEDKKVAIFHYASFLKRHKRYSYLFIILRNLANFHSQIFPKGLIEETLNTLALLFPSSDKYTEQWLSKLPEEVDNEVTKCGQLRAEKRQIENFKFWHDRLIILKQVFDQSRPATLKQWWLDRRNGVQWYTFWVAVLVLFLTVFFGIIQSIEGALQVYKAYYPTTL